MVAISLYRGNLHKLPNGPRRWTLPTPKISPKNFKILTRRRAKALARLHLSSSEATTDTNPNHDPYADPNPSESIPICNPPADNKYDDGTTETELALTDDLKERRADKEDEEEGEWEKDGGDGALKKLGLDETDDASVEEKIVNNVEIKEEGQSDPVERHNSELATSEKDKMIKEIEGKLEVLNQKKHKLVQVLKLILSAEEQMKKQNSVQGASSGGEPLPLEVDTTDSVSLNRVNTPRIGSDGIETETDDCLNQNEHSPQLPRVSSTSPSSDSQNQKPASNMVTCSNKTSVGVGSVSPLCFVPVESGHPISTVSGGTSYIASSPSPAASGGTSVFRDVGLPSPLN